MKKYISFLTLGCLIGGLQAGNLHSAVPVVPGDVEIMHGLKRGKPIPPAVNAKLAALQESDADFAKKAAEDSMLEIELGKIALQKAASQEVKDFGKMMIDDHTAANQELVAIAGEQEIELPTELSPEKKQVVDELSAKSGEEFDRAYINKMMEDHEKAISLYENAIENLSDQDLKDFATRTLPVLQTHHERAQELSDELN